MVKLTSIEMWKHTYPNDEERAALDLNEEESSALPSPKVVEHVSRLTAPQRTCLERPSVIEGTLIAQPKQAAKSRPPRITTEPRSAIAEIALAHHSLAKLICGPVEGKHGMRAIIQGAPAYLNHGRRGVLQRLKPTGSLYSMRSEFPNFSL